MMLPKSVFRIGRIQAGLAFERDRDPGRLEVEAAGEDEGLALAWIERRGRRRKVYGSASV